MVVTGDGELMRDQYCAPAFRREPAVFLPAFSAAKFSAAQLPVLQSAEIRDAPRGKRPKQARQPSAGH